MNTLPNERAGRNTAQETVQTVLLILVSILGAWLGLYRVPWQLVETHASLPQPLRCHSSSSFG